MRVFSRDAWLAVILLVLLVVITLAAGFSSAGKPEVLPYTTASTAPDGVNALWQWLQANGYPITNESPSVFSIAPKVGTILLLEPSEIVADSEWQIIDDWIDGGAASSLSEKECPQRSLWNTLMSRCSGSLLQALSY